MPKYRVVEDGWLVRGDYIAPGTVLTDSYALSIPNVAALVAEGVLESFEEPVEAPKTRRGKTDA